MHLTPPSFGSVAGAIAPFGQTLVHAAQSTQISEIEAFFSGEMETAPRGQTSTHKPHPTQVSQSTIIIQSFNSRKAQGVRRKV